MTENEALNALKLEGGLQIDGKAKRVAQFFEGLSVAEEALTEIQQYRAIGTIDEFKALKENGFFNFDSPVVRVDEKSYNKAIGECIKIIEETAWKDTDMLVESIRELKGVQE